MAFNIYLRIKWLTTLLRATFTRTDFVIIFSDMQFCKMLWEPVNSRDIIDGLSQILNWTTVSKITYLLIMCVLDRHFFNLKFRGYLEIKLLFSDEDVTHLSNINATITFLFCVFLHLQLIYIRNLIHVIFNFLQIALLYLTPFHSWENLYKTND